MGNPMIDTYLKGELRYKGFTSVGTMCQKAMKFDKWHWKVFPDVGHYFPIWDKRVREAVNKVIPINMKYVGPRPPSKPALGARYRIGKKAKMNLEGKYRRAEKNKAFAIGSNSSFGYTSNAPSPVDAIQGALFWCQKITKRSRCAIYDVNGRKVLGRRYSYVVQRVQQRLSALGFNVGNSDGLWGSKTKKALNEFRANKGHTQIDKIDQSSLKSLGLEGLKLDTNK
jgi:hypothetical protein